MIQRLLGHEDTKTTLIYAELSQRTIQYEYERIIAYSMFRASFSTDVTSAPICSTFSSSVSIR